MEYRHEDCFDMFLTLGNRNGLVGAAAREYAARYPAHYPSANMSLLLEQPLRETGSVPPTEHVKADRLRNVQTPVTEYAIIRSCRTRAVETPTQYRKTVGTLPTEGPRSTS
jgi:hypothetical protein